MFVCQQYGNDCSFARIKRPRWRPVGLNDRHLRSHGKIGDCEQSILSKENEVNCIRGETAQPARTVYYRFLTRPSFHEAGLSSKILLSCLNKKNRPQKIAVKYRIKTIRGYTTIQVPITKGDLLSDGLIYTFN